MAPGLSGGKSRYQVIAEPNILRGAVKDITFKVGVIGHRDLGGADKNAFTHFYCHRLLAGIKKKYASVVAVSAISDGADSIFAQSAITLGIALESIIPFGDFHSDFKQDLNFETYRSLRKQSQYETRTTFSRRHDLAYKKSMDWLVFKSNIVVAVWNGKEEGSTGGTWEAVSLVRKIRKSMIHLDNENKAINFYFNKGGEYTLHQNVSVDRIMELI